MEDLNKHQIVLLTLLISFVTSIATGIMTVSLLQEAPLEVTRNINRIVEKTIETVTPATILTPQQKEVTTVVVKEEDLIIDSINKNIKSVVRIKEKDSLTNITDFYGIGLVMNKEGFIATDRKTITGSNIYTAVMSDETEFTLTPIGLDKQTNFILFNANIPPKTSDGKDIKNPYIFSPAVLSDGEPKLGQTLIGLGGDSENAVAVGRIVSLEMRESGTGSTTVRYLSGLNTDLSTENIVSGSPLFNLSGDVVGMKTSPEVSRLFTPSSILKKEITILSEVTKDEKIAN